MTVHEEWIPRKDGWWYIAAYYDGSLYRGSFQEFRKEKPDGKTQAVPAVGTRPRRSR